MRIFGFIGLYLWVMSALCQNDQGLDLVLTQYQTDQAIKLSFDHDMISQIHTSDLARIDKDSLISFLEKSFPLQVEKIEDNYYIISLVESEYLVSLYDSTSHEYIAPDISSVLINGKSIPNKLINNQLSFSYLPSIADTINIYSPGFETLNLSFEDLLNQKNLSVTLTPIFIELNSVIIKDYITEGIDLDPASQSINIDVSALPLLPGETDGDIFASLSSLPGITTPDNRAGNLYIRGSSTDQSFVMLDNIPIYSRGHYFGTISPYNSKVINEVEVHRNGFHPRMGGRVGGAVEIKTDGATSNNIQGGIGANTLFTMGYIKSPIFNQKVGLSISARRSFPTSFISPKLEAITEMVYAGSAVADINTGELLTDVDVTFEDYQASVNIPLSKRDNLYLSSLFSRSKIAYLVTQSAENVPEQTTNYNLGLSGNWKRLINDQLHSNLNISFSSYDLKFLSNNAIKNVHPLVKGTYSINSISDLGIIEELNLNLPSGNSLDFGVEYRQQGVKDKYKGATVTDEPEFLRESDQIATTVSPFFNYSIHQWENWYLQFGSRVNYYNLINHWSFAPRIFFNWNISNSFILKGSSGLYYQYISQAKGLEFSSGGFDNELWLLADNVFNKPIQGIQSMAGFIWSKNQWVIDVEVYNKTAKNVTYFSSNRLLYDKEFTWNDHYIKGFDLFIRKKINEHIDTWAGYGYSDFKVDMDTARYNSRYSQPHNINIGFSYHQNNFKFSTGWRLSSGLNGNSPELAYKRADFYNGTFTAKDPFTALAIRYPMVHFWDLSASYKIPKTDSRKWSSTFGLSLINIYNQENLTDEVVRSSADPQNPNFVDRNAISFAPNLMITIEW